MKRTAICLLLLAFAVSGFISAQNVAAAEKPSVHFTSEVMPLVSRYGCNLSKCHAAAAFL